MQTYIQLEGFVKSNNETMEVIVHYLAEKYKMEKEEVKKYIDGVTVNPDETYDFLDKVYVLTKTTKQKQRLVFVHVAEYCIEKLAGRADIVAVSHKKTTQPSLFLFLPLTESGILYIQIQNKKGRENNGKNNQIKCV